MYPLTHEQHLAAATMAHRQLLVAAAGSGKTSTMVGTVVHALQKGQLSADQILVLAFNSKAARELDFRLQRSLRGLVPTGTNVTTRTLHALGLDIVTRASGRRPRVTGNDADTATSRSRPDALIRVIENLIQTDVAFAEDWLLFRIFYHAKVSHPDDFPSMRQWRRFVIGNGVRRAGQHGFLSLRHELLPTQFEQAVANWLSLHQIRYTYGPTGRGRFFGWLSRGWPERLAVARPLTGRLAFNLHELGVVLRCVRRPARPAAGVIEATLADFRAGIVFERLRQRLNIRVDNISQASMAAVMSRLGHPLTPHQKVFLRRFIRCARLNGTGNGTGSGTGNDTGRGTCSGTGPATFAGRICFSSDPGRAALHAPMLSRLLAAHEAALRQEGAIDFEGMLAQAALDLDAGRHHHPFRLILVDEFQDTSHAAVRLLQALLRQAPSCKLFAVGDDWQSIYRFAGAAPDVLLNFEDYFGAAVRNRLTATFRFNQHIADITSGFIQANPLQLRKQVVAQSRGSASSLVLLRYGSLAHMMALCLACLNDIEAGQADPGEGAPPTTVYILGRYRHQRPADLSQWQQRFVSLQIEFYTVHAAKGLEADVIIVLGLHAGRHGFPAETSDDPLMELVMPPLEAFPHAEERRLFYVALTRSRSRVYLLAALANPSSFVLELLGRDGALVESDLYEAARGG